MSAAQYFETILLVVICSAVAGVVIGYVMDIGYKGKKMKTLDEHNRERMEAIERQKNPGNGISCPKCGSELYDAHPHSVLTSDPAKMEVDCRSCGYQGYRLV